MSPTEDDLRAALRLDEPEAPSGLTLIGLAHEARRTRRRNVLYTAASMCAVLVVAGIAWGAHNLTSTSTASSAVSATGERAAVANGDAQPQLSTPASAAPLPASAVTCPTTYDFVPAARPEPVGSPLFASGISSLTLCRYDGTRDDPPIGSFTLNAEQATTQAVAINAVTLYSHREDCVDGSFVPVPSLLMIATYADGQTQRIGVDLGCGGEVMVSQTGAARYAPDLLNGLLALVKVAASQSLANPVSGVPMSHGPGPS